MPGPEFSRNREIHSAAQYIDRVDPGMAVPGHGRGHGHRPRGQPPSGPCTKDVLSTTKGGDGAWGRIRTTDTRIFNPMTLFERTGLFCPRG